MAVAAPVLERKVDTDNSGYTRETYRDNFMTAEEKHNSQISYNYLKLINPESTLKDFAKMDAPVKQSEETDLAPAVEDREEPTYLVENARADSDIFRAESAINRRMEVAEVQAEEEENEDLRPTPTTIQYRTESVVRTTEEGKIKAKRAKSLCLTKKDKIVIAVALAVIVALFVLIIVNSAVISGLNSEVSVLQETLSAAEESLSEVQSAKDAYLSEANLFQVVTDFAQSNGMVLR